MSAHPTFPAASRKYHQIGALSLLCSEWEEVGHARMKHRHQRAVSREDMYLKSWVRTDLFKYISSHSLNLCVERSCNGS